MALAGGGSANTVNPTGTGSGINYVGNHAYAYSGISDSSGTETNYLDFTTGNGYIVAKVQPVYAGQSTNNIQWLIYLDGQIINQVEVTSSRDYTPYDALLLVIPAYTHVQIAVDNVSGGTDPVGVVLTGEVFY
jgi:hypothetical protein